MPPSRAHQRDDAEAVRPGAQVGRRACARRTRARPLRQWAGVRVRSQRIPGMIVLLLRASRRQVVNSPQSSSSSSSAPLATPAAAAAATFVCAGRGGGGGASKPPPITLMPVCAAADATFAERCAPRPLFSRNVMVSPSLRP